MNKVKVIIGFIVFVSIIMILIGVSLLLNQDNDSSNKVITNDIYTDQVEDLVVENDIVYDTDNMMLISDYNTFYTLEKIVKEIVTNIYNAEYDYVLGTISEDFFDKSNKNVIKDKLEKFNKIITDENYMINEYSKILYQVYERNTNEYDCLLNIQNDIHYLLIYLNKDDMTYEIRDFILSEEVE